MSFHHEPLQSGEIRLLRFTTRHEATFEFELDHFAAAAAPRYLALSYTWGLPKDDGHRITLGRKVFEVRENLYRFLVELDRRRILKSDSLADVVYWWIDAICINQSDDAEKTQQVKKMREIFATAYRVVAWLGPKQDNSDVGMMFARNIARLKFRSLKKPMQAQKLFLEYQRAYSRDITEEYWLAYNRLIERPWWFRAWIVQEVCNHNHVWVWCGQAESLLADFRFAETALQGFEIGYFTPATPQLSAKTTMRRESDRALKVHNTSINQIWRCHLRTTEIARQILTSPTEVLYDMRERMCADPRDRIFAFMFAFEDGRSIKVDYAKCVRQTYLDFTRQQLSNEQWDVLSACTSGGCYFRLPSWVPALDRPLQPDLFSKWSWDSATSTRTAVYTASSGLSTHIPKLFEIEQVAIGGAHIDTVRDITQVRYQQDLDKVGTNWLAFAREAGHDMDTVAHVLCADLRPWAIGLPGARRGGAELVHCSLRTADGIDASMFNLPAVHPVTWRRRLFSTEKGKLGIGPPLMEAGDLVCVLCNCPMPFILRRQGDEFVIVGEAFVHGFMDGEAVTVDTEVTEFIVC